MEMIAAKRLNFYRIRMDNGPELISQKIAYWAAWHDVELAFIQPGKPSHNAHFDQFNWTFH